MGSAGALMAVAAVLVQVPFGAEVTVRCQAVPVETHAGADLSDWLVTAVEDEADTGTYLVRLRPLALGVMPVPCAEAEPSALEVVASLPPDSPPAPPRLLLAGGIPWAAVLISGLLAGTAALTFRRIRRGRRPVATLIRALRPMTHGDAWRNPETADLVARCCRSYLTNTAGVPAHAMTGHELISCLSHAEPATKTVLDALEFCDLVRFAGGSPAAGPETVARVLASARGKMVSA